MQLNISDQMADVINDALAYVIKHKITIKHDDGHGYEVDAHEALAFFAELRGARERARTATRQNRS